MDFNRVILSCRGEEFGEALECRKSNLIDMKCFHLVSLLRVQTDKDERARRGLQGCRDTVDVITANAV